MNDIIDQLWTPGAGIAFALGLSLGILYDRATARIWKGRA